MLKKLFFSSQKRVFQNIENALRYNSVYQKNFVPFVVEVLLSKAVVGEVVFSGSVTFSVTNSLILSVADLSVVAFSVTDSLILSVADCSVVALSVTDSSMSVLDKIIVSSVVAISDLKLNPEG